MKRFAGISKNGVAAIIGTIRGIHRDSSRWCIYAEFAPNFIVPYVWYFSIKLTTTSMKYDQNQCIFVIYISFEYALPQLAAMTFVFYYFILTKVRYWISRLYDWNSSFLSLLKTHNFWWNPKWRVRCFHFLLLDQVMNEGENGILRIFTGRSRYNRVETANWNKLPLFAIKW